MVHVYNGILLSHKKEWNNFICNYMNGPRDYQAKWNKNASGKNMSEWHWKISTLPVIDPALKNGAAISNGKDMKTT